MLDIRLIAGLLSTLWFGVLDGSPIKKASEEIGLIILGAIQQSSGSGVALVKEAESGKVQAVKAGYKILNDKYLVKAVSDTYLTLEHDKKVYHIYKDKFLITDGRKPVTATPKSAKGSYYKEEGFERRENNVTMSASYRDKMINEDLAKILLQATAEPYVEDGVIMGFQISQIDAGSIYEKGGLLDGDVITSINGNSLTSVGNAINTLKSMKKIDDLEIEVNRGGVSSTITIQVK